MPSYEQLAIGRGIAQGLEQGVENFINIRKARTEEEERKKQADIDIKIKKLKLQQMESELDPDTLELEQEKLKAETQAKKVSNQLNMVKIKETERGIRKDIENTKNSLMFRNTYLRGIQEGKNLELPPGMSITQKMGDTTVKVGSEKEKSLTEQYRDDLNAAKSSQITWDDIKQKYPEPSKQKDIEEVRRSTLPKLERSPAFRMGKGLSALISEDVANINEETLGVIREIENQEDLDELVAQKDEYEAEGIDVDAILEYFGKK